MIVSTKPAPDVVGVVEAAEILGITTGRVRQLLLDKDSHLPGFKVGTSWGIKRSDLLKFQKLQRPAGNPNFKNGKN